MLIFGYIISFVYKTLYNDNTYNTINTEYISNDHNTTHINNISIKHTSREFRHFIGIFFYVYNRLKQFTTTKAFYFCRLLEKFNRYLLVSILIHIIALFYFGQSIVFKSIKNDKNWVYTDLSLKDIEEKAIADSAPEDTLAFEEPQTVENSEENDSNSSISVGIETFNEKIDIPAEYVNASVPPILKSHEFKNPVSFKVSASDEQIKSGKQILYKEGKISNIDGYGLDGQGSGLTGRGAGKGTGGNGLREGKIFGDNIKAERLGVIIDNSPSMVPYMEALKREIYRNFDNAKIVQAHGCQIVTGSQPLFAFKNLAREKVDVIYWFCDLQDAESLEGLKVLEKILKDKNIKLYIKSMDRPPNDELESIIRSSGGNYFIGLN